MKTYIVYIDKVIITALRTRVVTCKIKVEAENIIEACDKAIEIHDGIVSMVWPDFQIKQIN